MSFTKNSLILLIVFVNFAGISQDIKWLSWEEATTANDKKPKKLFVDIYTDWCGWCKRMDQGTFKDSSIIAYMNANFYAVKLNAEQKESIFWQDTEFKWMEGGRNGFNTLAVELLDRQMSFPSFVILDGAYAKILVSPGYKEAPALLKQLKFAKEEAYRDGTWEEYQSKS